MTIIIKNLSVFLISLSLLLSITTCSSQTDSTHVSQNTEDTLQEKTSNIANMADNDNLELSHEELLGKVKPWQHAGFTKIQSTYTNKSNIYLRKEAYEAFLQMAEAAAEEGLHLRIISATRNFQDQKWIWESKWTGQRTVDGQKLNQTIPNPAKRALKILEYSAMPGTSRHHWGTDIDLNALNNEYFASGRGKQLYEWLQNNANTYGFCQVYTEKGLERPYGYNEEKWHWSYMPLSSQFLRQYTAKIGYHDISGFKGAEAAEEIAVISKYVEGIAPACKD